MDQVETNKIEYSRVSDVNVRREFHRPVLAEAAPDRLNPVVAKPRPAVCGKFLCIGAVVYRHEVELVLHTLRQCLFHHRRLKHAGSVKFLLDYSTRPLQILRSTRVGMVSGSLIMLVLLYDKLWLHEPLTLQHGPLLLLAVALVVGGIQFISLGLVGEMLSRTYYESQKKPIYALREMKAS